MKFSFNYDQLYTTKWNSSKNKNETVQIVCTTAQEAVKKYLDLKTELKENFVVQEQYKSKGFLITAYSLNSFLKCLENMGCKDILIVPYDMDKELGHLYLILITTYGKLEEIKYII